MKYLIPLISVLALSACDYAQPVERPGAPAVSRNARPYAPDPSTDRRQVVVAGRPMNASDPEAVSFRDVNVCDAAEIVLVAELGLAVTCSASGKLSLNFPKTTAKNLYEAFSASLGRIGVKVSWDGKSLALTGGNGGEASAQFGVMPDGLPSGELVSEDVQAYTYETLPDPIERRILSETFATSSLGVRFFPSLSSIDQFSQLGSSLGLDLQGSVLAGGILAVGGLNDLDILATALSDSANLTVPIEVSGASEASIEALSTAFVGLNISYDPDNSSIWVSGPSQVVIESIPVLRSRFRPGKDVRIDAVFLAYDATDLRSFDLTGSFDLGFGDLRVMSGKLPIGTPLNLVVDQMVETGSASVVSRPSLTTSTGQTSRFVSGSQVPILSSIGDEGEQNFDYRDTGVVISATPQLLPSGRYKVRLNVEVSSVDGVGISDNPTFTTREVATTIEIASGETVALSGLELAEKSSTKGRSLLLPSSASQTVTRSLAFFVSVTDDF